MNQLSFSGFEYAGKRKQTRHERFLAEMDQVAPCTGPLGLIFRLAVLSPDLHLVLLGSYGGSVVKRPIQFGQLHANPARPYTNVVEVFLVRHVMAAVGVIAQAEVFARLIPPCLGGEWHRCRLAPYAVGWLKDATGSFTAGLLGMGCMLCLATLLTGVLGAVVKRDRDRGTTGHVAAETAIA